MGTFPISILTSESCSGGVLLTLPIFRCLRKSLVEFRDKGQQKKRCNGKFLGVAVAAVKVTAAVCWRPVVFSCQEVKLPTVSYGTLPVPPDDSGSCGHFGRAEKF